jgi:hypothetical protein
MKGPLPMGSEGGARRAAVQHPRAACGGIRGRATRIGDMGQHGGCTGGSTQASRSPFLGFRGYPQRTNLLLGRDGRP